MSEAVLSVWTIYDHPLDFPEGFVARRFQIERNSDDPVPTQDTLVADSLEPLRDKMEAMGLTCLPRNPGDQPQIVESWV